VLQTLPTYRFRPEPVLPGALSWSELGAYSIISLLNETLSDGEAIAELTNRGARALAVLLEPAVDGELFVGLGLTRVNLNPSP